MSNDERTPYRAAGAATCPQCATLMDLRRVPYDEVNGETVQVNVDVCPSCAGIWLDGDDGNERALVRSIMQEEGEAVIGTEDEDARPMCPRCSAPLGLDFELRGAVAYRCESCAGAFLPRPQAEALAAAAPGTEDFREAIRRLAAARKSR